MNKGSEDFCCSDCYYEYRAIYPKKKVHINNCKCLRCGKEFYTYLSGIKRGGGKYCSPKCRGRESKVFKCLTCGKEFQRGLSWLKRGTVKYCSRECRNKRERRNKRELNCKCVQCGREFRRSPRQIENGVGKYCSKNCQNEGHEKVKGTCEFCGKKFYKFRYKEKINRGKYCSRSCARKDKVGEKSPSWRGGLSFKKYCKFFNNTFKEKIRERFDRNCFMCNKSEQENEQRLSVHHIDYFKASICRGRDWAFVPLCKSCHSRTGHNRYVWFNLLINYWVLNPEINLRLTFNI
jgi:hypothetical protein